MKNQSIHKALSVDTAVYWGGGQAGKEEWDLRSPRKNWALSTAQEESRATYIEDSNYSFPCLLILKPQETIPTSFVGPYKTSTHPYFLARFLLQEEPNLC